VVTKNVAAIVAKNRAAGVDVLTIRAILICFAGSGWLQAK
jgi:hypothetical protein